MIRSPLRCLLVVLLFLPAVPEVLAGNGTTAPSRRPSAERIPGDADGDGWNDLWTLIYSHSFDNRTWEAHLKTDPHGDADGGWHLQLR